MSLTEAEWIEILSGTQDKKLLAKFDAERKRVFHEANRRIRAMMAQMKGKKGGAKGQIPLPFHRGK